MNTQRHYKIWIAIYFVSIPISKVHNRGLEKGPSRVLVMAQVLATYSLQSSQQIGRYNPETSLRILSPSFLGFHLDKAADILNFFNYHRII